MGSEKVGVFSSAVASVRKRFFDNFNRPDQTGLGTATDGSSWRQVRGQFNIVSNRAVGDSSNYPMAVEDNIPFTNVDIDLLGITQGSSAALWVTDSGNWWAVGIDQVAVTNCQTCSDCVSWNASNCASWNASSFVCNSAVWNQSTCTTWGGNTVRCNTWNVFQWNCNTYNAIQNTCNSWNASFTFCAAWTRTGGNCTAWNAGRTCRLWSAIQTNCSSTGFQASNCASSFTFGGNCQSTFSFQFGGNCQTSFQTWNAGTCNASNASNFQFCLSGTFTGSSCASSNTSTCAAFNSYACNCVTTYPQYIRILQSVNSTVSEMWSTTVGAIVQSLRVLTNGTQITVKAYSDTNLTNQIGSDLVYTPTGATVVSSYGITIKPSSWNQGNSIDGIEITRN